MRQVMVKHRPPVYGRLCPRKSRAAAGAGYIGNTHEKHRDQKQHTQDETNNCFSFHFAFSFLARLRLHHAYMHVCVIFLPLHYFRLFRCLCLYRFSLMMMCFNWRGCDNKYLKPCTCLLSIFNMGALTF